MSPLKKLSDWYAGIPTETIILTLQLLGVALVLVGLGIATAFIVRIGPDCAESWMVPSPQFVIEPFVAYLVEEGAPPSQIMQYGWIVDKGDLRFVAVGTDYVYSAEVCVTEGGAEFVELEITPG